MVELPEVLKVVDLLREEGFEVEFSPERGVIRVKGKVVRVDVFGVQEIVVSNGKKNIYYWRDCGDNFIEIGTDNDEEDESGEPIYLGRDLEVVVRYDGEHLVILYPNLK